MKTLIESISASCIAESILDADFVDQPMHEDIIADFVIRLEKFKPKNEKEAFTYYWATRGAFYKILMDINDHYSAYNNKLKLQLLSHLVMLPGDVEVPYWNPEEEMWQFDNPNRMQWDELIMQHEEDIDKNKFVPWASNWSSGSLLYTFFDEQPDPGTLPEHLYKGFNRAKYNKIQKELLDLAVKTISKLSK